MTSIEQLEYAHKCLNRMLEIDEQIHVLDKERDSKIIEELKRESLQIQLQADRFLLSSVS